MPIFKPFETNGECLDISYEGYGVFKDGEITAFITGMFPGDEGDVIIEYKRNGNYFGHIKKLSKFSENRINPPCKVCTACGGCQFQALSYEEEKKFKTRMVKEQFKIVAGMDVIVNDTRGMDEPYNYRNKIQMPIGWNMYHNRPIYGFYRHGTHRIIENTDCKIDDIKAKPVLGEIIKSMEELNIDPYDEKDGSGIIRNIMIRTSKKYGEVMVVVVSTKRNFNHKKEFFDNLRGNCGDISTIILNINNKDTNIVLGDQYEIIYGSGKIKDNLCGLDFEISSKSFFQTNPTMTEALYSKAIEVADLKMTDTVLDAYSGIGTIGLIASKSCGKIMSVELAEEACKDAEKNAKINKIENFKCLKGDAAEYLSNNEIKFDVVFMDPPRKGSSKQFLDALIKNKPSKVVYISCNPSTLARDIKYLSSDYSIISIDPFDMFSRTCHVETVVSLRLKER